MGAAVLMVLTASFALASSRQEVVSRVVASGMPDCLSYLEDGTVQPCRPAISVTAALDISAVSKGAEIEISRGASQRLNKDEFALLVGHEVAHWYLGHSASNVTNELEADALGASLACQAGYNPQRGASLFRFLTAGTTHPEPEMRRNAVKAVPCFKAQYLH